MTGRNLLGARARSTLTYLDKSGRRKGLLVDRPGRAMLVSQAAWATLTDRQPLLDGQPPYASKDDARAALERMRADYLTRSMAERALAAVARHEAAQ